MEYVSGFTQGDIHREFQDFLSAKPSNYIEFPRGHGKTTQFAYRTAFVIGHNQNIRIKYVSQNDDEAGKTVKLIEEIIEKDEYRRVFPHVVPDKRNWGTKRFNVQRTASLRDSTVEGSGIFGRAGGRYDIIIADDLCDLRSSILMPSLREQIKEAWANTWLPMADPTGGKRPLEWKAGTPWHMDDITADFRKVHGADGSLLRVPCEGFRSPWAEQISEEYLRERYEKGALAYARAYELRPLSSADCPIKPEFFRYWHSESEIPAGGRKVVGVDPANRKEAHNDFTVLCPVVYSDPVVYVVGDFRPGKGWRDKWSAPDLLRAIKAKGHAFQPQEFTVEDVAYQNSIAEHLVEMTDFPYPVTAYTPSADPDGKSKFTKAAWLAVMLENGKIRLMGDARTGGVHETQQTLYTELAGFPAADHDDCLDALFYAAKRAMLGSGFRIGW